MHVGFDAHTGEFSVRAGHVTCCVLFDWRVEYVLVCLRWCFVVAVGVCCTTCGSVFHVGLCIA